MLIDPKDAVQICRQVARHEEIMRESRSTFLRGFTSGVAEVHAKIINDFFTLDDLKGKRILDVGPGLYPFSILARELGATVVAIEFDEALAEVGKRIGFEVHTDNIDMLPEGKFTGYDGIFLKGPFNPCRQTFETLPKAVSRITGTIHEKGWGWNANSVHPVRLFKPQLKIDFIMPLRQQVRRGSKFENDSAPLMSYAFNSHSHEIPDHMEISFVRAEYRRKALTKLQQRCFIDTGWADEIPTEEQLKLYALTYMHCPYLFTKNLRTIKEIETRKNDADNQA